MYIASIVGNIASGKSTAAKILNQFGYFHLKEDFKGNEYLDRYYSDKKEWALRMELKFEALLYEQFHSLVASKNPKFIVIDWNIPEVFARMMKSEKILSEEDFRLFFDIKQRLTIPTPDITIFLDVDPKICLRRIKSRKRDMEKGIDLKYLQKLQEKYEKYLDGYKGKVITLKNDKIEDMKKDIKTAVLNELLPENLASEVSVSA